MSITVAIPCYNGAAFIGQTIEAILSQSRPPDDVILIDDGSTDASAEIISGYPVRLVRHAKNQGLSAGRNTALENTRTEYIVYVDADAYADPEMLAALEEEFCQAGADPMFAGAGGQGLEAVQDTVYDHWRSLHASQSFGPQRIERMEYLAGLCMGYRTHVLKEAGGFYPMFRTNGEDMDMGWRLNDAGYHLIYTPKARVYHQRRDDHASLRRMMYQWYYWAFISKKKNGRQPWNLISGTLRRMVYSDTVVDLIRYRSPALARLDVELSIVKLQGILAAARSGVI